MACSTCAMSDCASLTIASRSFWPTGTIIIPSGPTRLIKNERAARASNVGVGQIRPIEHQVRVRCGARDAAVLVDAVPHRRQHVRDAGPRRRMILAALEALHLNRLDLGA